MYFSSVITIHDVQKKFSHISFINLKYFPFSLCAWDTHSHWVAWIFSTCLSEVTEALEPEAEDSLRELIAW